LLVRLARQPGQPLPAGSGLRQLRHWIAHAAGTDADVRFERAVSDPALRSRAQRDGDSQR
jgi:hypothetical protein